MPEEERLHVVGWADYDSDYPDASYAERPQEEYIDAIIDEIINNKYVFGGDTHQNNPHGVPVLSDGTAVRFSMRAWGVIMATAHGNKTDDGTPNYMDYYSLLDSEVIPQEDPTVEPNEKVAKEGGMPIIIGIDSNLMNETIAIGMKSLMTTDKAILLYFPLFQKRAEAKNKK